MKNILHDEPSKRLYGRTHFTTKFVDDYDIKSKICLDIGCGWGWFEIYALKRNVKRIIGLEITENDLLTARKEISDKKVEFKIGTATKLPVRDLQIDTIVLWEVIEHIPKNQELKMFDEVFRVLKENGSFYLSTPNYSFWCNIFDPAWWLIGHRHYKLSKLIKLGLDSGFVLEKFEIRSRWWEIIGLNNMYFSKWILRRKPICKNYFNKKIDNEYETKQGFVTIFVKFKKIAKNKKKPQSLHQQ